MFIFRCLPMNEVQIYKPNELIGIIERNNISRVARHLWTFLLQYAQQQIKFHNHKGVDFEVSVSQINGLAEIHQKNYKLLQNALECLMSPVRIRDDPNCYESVVPVTRIKIDVASGVYKFRLEELVIDLLRTTEYFTIINITEFNPFKSKHSHVLYEWLKRWETSPQMPLLQIDVLRGMTNTADKKAYDNFTNIRDKILDVAVKEINEHTKYIASYQPIKTRAKTRNKVTAVQFYFSKKEIKTEVENKPDDSVINMPSGYEKLRKVCGRYMTLKFYYEATYIYEPETLERFADDCAEKYKPNRTKFFEWLDERCGMNQKGYFKQKYIYSEKFFKSVFSTEEIDPSSVVTTDDGREMWLGGKIKTVHEEYVSEAMKFYGELPYNEYKHYLSGIWQRFQQQFNVNEDNVFE